MATLSSARADVSEPERLAPGDPLARAQARLRVGDLPGARVELVRVAEARGGACPEVTVCLAEVALASGDVGAALEQVRALAGDDGLRGDPVRVAHVAALALVHAGQTDQALAVLRRAAARSCEPASRALVACAMDQCLWIAGRSPGGAGDVPPWRAGASSAAAAIAATSAALAELGEIEEAERRLAAVEAGMHAAEDPLLALELAACRAVVRHERGERCLAIEGLRRCIADFVRAGHGLGAAWYRTCLARWLLVGGHRREARKLLDEACGAAQRLGLVSVLEAARRVETGDPLRALQGDEPAPPPRQKRGEWTRAYAIAALRAATRGEQHHAASLMAEVEVGVGPDEPGYALDRVLAHLARATLLAIDGREAEASAAVTRAWQAAASEALDTDLVADVIAGLGDVVVVTCADDRRLAPASAIAVPADVVVIDARSHELTVGGVSCSLKRRSVLRRLLYALARRPGSVLGKDDLAEAVWERPYDPVRHDDALKSNILHLRRLLAGSGLVIARGDPGYRLDAVGRFVFIAPFELIEDRRFAVADLAPRRSARMVDVMPGDAGTAGAG